MTSNVKNIMAQLSKAAPLITPPQLMYDRIVDKEDANEIYTNLMPILDDLQMRGKRFESQEMQAVVEILRELPAYGVRRTNFQKRYLVDEYTLKKLPKDPNDIPYGFWH